MADPHPIHAGALCAGITSPLLGMPDSIGSIKTRKIMTALTPSTSTRATSMIITGIIAFVMIGGGVAHLIAPDYFAALVPPFLPARLVVLLAGVLQIAIGLAAILPKTRSLGALAFALICLSYMPLHLWDFFRPDPVFAPPVAATARIAVQAVFVWIGFVLWRRTRP